MTQALTAVNGPVALADELERKRELIRRTVAAGASDDELELFLHQARRTGLDPLSRQIYCIVRGRDGERRATIQTGIDGYRLIADRTGRYAGNDDAVFSGAGGELQASVTVWKMVAGVRCPFTATARLSEYKPRLGTAMWDRMPHTMIAKCAEALALRKAFPAELSGLYTAEEMDQAETIESTARVVTTRRPPTEPVPEWEGAADEESVAATRAAPPPMTEAAAIPRQSRREAAQSDFNWRSLYQYGKARKWDEERVDAECIRLTGGKHPSEVTYEEFGRVRDFLKSGRDG